MIKTLMAAVVNIYHYYTPEADEGSKVTNLKEIIGVIQHSAYSAMPAKYEVNGPKSNPTYSKMVC